MFDREVNKILPFLGYEKILKMGVPIALDKLYSKICGRTSGWEVTKVIPSDPLPVTNNPKNVNFFKFEVTYQ